MAGYRAGSLTPEIKTVLVLVGAPPTSLLFSTWAGSYLGDFSQDNSSVLLAPSQRLHGSQEFFSVLDFLHHCTEGKDRQCTGQWEHTGAQAVHGV